jgi:hypothetical protein
MGKKSGIAKRMENTLIAHMGHNARRYTLGFIQSVLGNDLEPHLIDEMMLEVVFKAISRTEEINNPARDCWGNWDWQYSAAQRRGQLYVPEVDSKLNEIRIKPTTVQVLPRWPGNKAFALCLTHDVDVAYSFKTIKKLYRLTKRWLDQKEKSQSALAVINEVMMLMMRRLRHFRFSQLDSLQHYEDWLKLEDAYSFKSTFFFFPSWLQYPHHFDCVYHFDDNIMFSGRKMSIGEMMREIDRFGWEIGLHGSFNSATESGLLEFERRQIEEVIGREVISTRQHWLHYDPRITPLLQAQAGIKADSTEGFNRSIGFRAGTSFPYWKWDHASNRPLPVLEIPLHIMDSALFGENALEYNQETAISHSVQLMNEVQKFGGCLTLNFHPNYLNDQKYWNTYRFILEEAHSRDAWGCSIGQLYNWWNKKNPQVMDA